MKKKTEAPATFVSRGVRRHNRSNNRGTINQNLAASYPKWENIGGEILKHIAPGAMPETYIRLQPGGFASVSKKKVVIT